MLLLFYLFVGEEHTYQCSVPVIEAGPPINKAHALSPLSALAIYDPICVCMYIYIYIHI